MAKGKYGSTDVKPNDKLDRNLEAIAAVTTKKKRKKKRRRGAEGFSPTERMKERGEVEEKGPVLGKRLSAIASGMGPGRGRVGKAIRGALTGAALGATIGESLSKKRRGRKKDEKQGGS